MSNLFTESEVIGYMINLGYRPESIDFWFDVSEYFLKKPSGWIKKEHVNG